MSFVHQTLQEVASTLNMAKLLLIKINAICTIKIYNSKIVKNGIFIKHHQNNTPQKKATNVPTNNNLAQIRRHE
jgi:hypothetical protein